jgi:hypothetical protein
MKDFQISRKEIQAKGNKNPNPAERNSKENPWISFAESSLIKELRRPPRPFFFLGRFRPSKAHRQRRRCLFVPDCPSSFCLHFGILRYSRARERLAPFRSRVLVLVRRLTPFPPDLAATSLNGAKKGTLHGPKARGAGKRQGDRSDLRQEYVRLKRARTGFQPLATNRNFLLFENTSH